MTGATELEQQLRAEILRKDQQISDLREKVKVYRTSMETLTKQVEQLERRFGCIRELVPAASPAGA